MWHTTNHISDKNKRQTETKDNKMAEKWETDSDSSAAYQAAINNSKLAKAQQMLDKIPDCLMWTETDTAEWVEKLGFPWVVAQVVDVVVDMV